MQVGSPNPRERARCPVLRNSSASSCILSVLYIVTELLVLVVNLGSKFNDTRNACNDTNYGKSFRTRHL